MRVRAIIVMLVAVLGAGATACGGSHPAPAKTPTATTSPTPTVSAAPDAAAAMKACVTALEKTTDGSTPPECSSLSQDAYFQAVQAANAAGQGGLASAIASAAGQP